MNKAQRFSAIKGMNDILPSQTAMWRKLEYIFRKVVETYGYKEIRTPIIENTALFKRGVGESTDIVEKEMYSFVDSLNGEKLSLRPENTASVMRAAIQHNLLYDGPKRLWYGGPMFRHERPQRGRYRQFYQIGVEALGFSGYEVDAELILMCVSLWKRLGLDNILQLELNCLGSAEERLNHRRALLAYFSKNKDILFLDETAKHRFTLNPLRILDSKKEILQPLLSQAPSILEFLDSKSLKHFEQVQLILNENGVCFRLNPRLVRGLDYYNLTVFEWVTNHLGTQGTVAAGGRYDSLACQLGGSNIPSCGWAMGVERLIELLNIVNEPFFQMKEVLLYIMYDDVKRLSMAIRLAELLRKNDFSVLIYSSGDPEKKISFKHQLKQASRSGACYVLILGEREQNTESVIVKPMRNPKNNEEVFSDQENVKMDQVISYLKNILR